MDNQFIYHATEIGIIQRLLPKRNAVTPHAKVLAPIQYYRWRQLNIPRAAEYLQSDFYAPLFRNAYVPITPTPQIQRTGCMRCAAPFTDHVHAPVMLRCGHISGEICVVNYIAECLANFDADWKRSPGRADVFHQCYCHIPDCLEEIGPFTAFLDGMAKQWRVEENIASPHTSTARWQIKDTSWMAPIILADLADFHGKIFKHWALNALSLPGMGSGLMTLVEIDSMSQGAISRVHRAIMVWPEMAKAKADWEIQHGYPVAQCAWMRVVLNGEWAVYQLMGLFREHGRRLKKLWDRDLIDGYVNRIKELMKQAAEGIKVQIDLGDKLLQWYLERLVRHSLVAMRIDQGTMF